MAVQQRQMGLVLLSLSIALLTPLEAALGLPPPEDTPEEILRTEIITEARSPLNGQPLTPVEYAELQAQLQANPTAPMVSPRLRHLIVLLQLRHALRTLSPISP